MPDDTELKNIFHLRKKLGKIDFSKIVEASCGYKVIPINSIDPQDTALIRHLEFALKNFLQLTKRTSSRFRGQRINDVGKKIEPLIVEEIKKTPLEITRLGLSGYPDFEIKQNERISFLELKTTGNIHKKKTHHRMFYFSSGKKITSDGRHLLLQIQMEEESNKYWKVLEWSIRDLSSLEVGLKTEFNANFQDLYSTPLLRSG